MEYWIRYAQSLIPDDCPCDPPCARHCQSRRHVIPLYKCAFPLPDEGLHHPFAVDFFSRAKIQEHFKQPGLIESLLSCECHQCRQARERTLALDDEERVEIIRGSQHGQVLFALMIYLESFHLVYAWFASGDRERELRQAISQMHRYNSFDPFTTSEEHKHRFRMACDYALEMFDPVQLCFAQTPRNQIAKDYGESQRFPFCAEEELPGGSFGSLTKFEIVPEYCDRGSVEPVMREYPGSVVGHGGQKKLMFARKSVKTNTEYAYNLALAEQNMLRMVSKIDKPAANNIVTLLTCYNWRNEMHFVFPYIEDDLFRALRCQTLNDKYSWRSNPLLPENSLWKEMIGVAEALSAIHTGMNNPFRGIEGKVFACHFDLKPANILVTTDGKLKIADFGQSSIDILSQGGEQKVQYKGGDPRYAAPESLVLTTQIDDEWLQLDKDGSSAALKYDVWSLACIMTEVLIFLLNKDSPEEHLLAKFDESLDNSSEVLFKKRFFDRDGVKECVKSTIEGFQDKVPAGSELSQYVSSVVVLLLSMFQHKNEERISSPDVLRELQSAKTAFYDRRNLGHLAFELRLRGVPDNPAFREVGWRQEKDSSELVQFVEMDGIKIEVVSQYHPERRTQDQDQPCRIRLFCRPEGSGRIRELILFWAVGPKDNVTVDDETISFPRWAIKPTYLFQERQAEGGRFECALFPAEKQHWDQALIFSFQRLSDLHAFQGALLQRTIMSKFEFSGASFQLTTSERSTARLASASVQFWAKKSADILPSNRTTGGSVHSESRTNTMKPEDMVIFSRGEPLLRIPLNNTQKRFMKTGNGRIHVSYRDDEQYNHRYFDAFKSLPCYPWQLAPPDGSVSLMGSTPAIRMDERTRVDNRARVKIVEMYVGFGAEQGSLKRLFHATRGNWWDGKDWR